MWDHASGCISPPQRIGKAQRDLLGDAAPCRRLDPEIREDAFVIHKWVGPPCVEEEPEPPGAPSGGPDDLG